MPTDPTLTPSLDSLKILMNALDVLGDLVARAPMRVYEIPIRRDAEVRGVGGGSLGAGMYRETGLTRQELAALRTQGPPAGEGLTLRDLPVPVTRLEGAEAARRCAGIYRKIHQAPGQKPRPDRLPGLVWIPGGAIRQAVEDVNRAKAAFIQEFRALRPRRDRASRAARAALISGTPLAGLIPDAAERQVILVREPVLGASFSWAAQSRVVHCVPTPVLKLYLNKRFKRAPVLDQWSSQLAAHHVAHAVCRVAAPFPVCNLKFEPVDPPKGNRQRAAAVWRRYNAHMPIILNADQIDPDLTIRDLPDYDPDALPAARRSPDRVVPAPLFMIGKTTGVHAYTDGGVAALQARQARALEREAQLSALFEGLEPEEGGDDDAQDSAQA